MNYESWKNCFNPHFFAYGQFPLYLGYFMIAMYHFLLKKSGGLISFEEATLALRFISAVSSILLVWIAIKTVILTLGKVKGEGSLANARKNLRQAEGFFTSFRMTGIVTLLLFTFSPGLIQLAHFGTTESLLMVLYLGIIYSSLLLLQKKIRNSLFIILTSLLSGMAIATKISSALFLAVPFFAMLASLHPEGVKRLVLARTMVSFSILTSLFTILFSPHNIISFPDFISSIHYEADIGTGRLIAFYTKQFLHTVPVVFQFAKIFPYALGWPVFLLFIIGFIFLPRNKTNNFLRFSWLIYFLPTAFFFAKWTRFMSPIFPLMILFASLELIVILNKVKDISFRQLVDASSNNLRDSSLALRMTTTTLLLILTILPGIAYLSIYQNPDTRFQASEWIYKNIPANSYILSEGANVVDIPIQTLSSKPKTLNYNITNFDFYNLDSDPILQDQLKEHLKKADYIFVPSRRVFANHKKQYPLVNKYYEDLFSGKLGFQKVAEFTSFPKLEIGIWKLELPDERAEETWSVFDHPVIRIYKRV